MDRYCL